MSRKTGTTQAVASWLGRMPSNSVVSISEAAEQFPDDARSAVGAALARLCDGPDPLLMRVGNNSGVYRRVNGMGGRPRNVPSPAPASPAAPDVPPDRDRTPTAVSRPARPAPVPVPPTGDWPSALLLDRVRVTAADTAVYADDTSVYKVVRIA